MMSTNNKLALQKSTSWHILHVVLLVATVFFVTGEVEIAATIVSIHVVSETILYYLHERMWLRIRRKSK